jgi:hypothetical protein
MLGGARSVGQVRKLSVSTLEDLQDCIVLSNVTERDLEPPGTVSRYKIWLLAAGIVAESLIITPRPKTNGPCLYSRHG